MITNLLLLITIKCLLTAWFITENQFIQDSLSKTHDFLYRKSNKESVRFILDTIISILSCLKCLSFFTTVLLTGSFFFAIGAAIVAQVYENKILK